jgi:hypothetical protein
MCANVRKQSNQTPSAPRRIELSSAAKDFMKSCKSKRAYSTRAHATEVLINMTRKPNTQHDATMQLNVYRCKFFNHWHIGHHRTTIELNGSR